MVNIIAELGINHQGDLEIMKKLMKEAKECGVNYVKGQKREPKEYLTEEQYNRPYNNQNSFGKTYGEHKEALEFSKNEWIKLFEYANEIDIKLFTSVFDITSASNMNSIGQEIFKIGSGEVTRLSLLEEVKSYDKLILLSTGMSTLDEIDKAVDVLKGSELVLMQCTSSYPCPIEDVNLQVIPFLKDRYKLPVGLSGHYVAGNGAIEAAAVALGASWIERHFTLDRTMKGSDHAASLESVGLKNVVKAVKSVELALGSSEKTVQESEMNVRKKIRGY
jgi:sialic acid synthase SpsE